MEDIAKWPKNVKAYYLCVDGVRIFGTYKRNDTVLNSFVLKCSRLARHGLQNAYVVTKYVNNTVGASSLQFFVNAHPVKE